jgi:hypothetical protein
VSIFDNDDEDMPGPVVVKSTVYEARMKLKAEVKPGERGPAFENARDIAAECRTAGDAAGAAFWEEVFNFLMGAATLLYEEHFAQQGRGVDPIGEIHVTVV